MSTASKPEKYYQAPITLGFTPTDGDIIRGTVNGVEVSGEWGISGVELFDSSKNKICSVGFNGAQSALVVDIPSAPTTDYELHLYRYVPASIVKIPREYVEGMEMLPNDGNPGDILVKTETGGAWQSFVEDMIEEDMLPAVKVGSDILGINNDILML